MDVTTETFDRDVLERSRRRRRDAMTRQVRHKEFRFPVTIDWDGGRRTTAHVDGKPPLAIATPPEFRGTDPELWSPEDAFVAAAGS